MAQMTSISRSPSLDVKRLAVAVAVLLSLSCSAIAWPRHLLQSNNKRYEAWGLVSTPRALNGMCSLRANV
ncbi:unnamed protein product, partial [Closterium sp. Naga37s-1]